MDKLHGHSDSCTSQNFDCGESVMDPENTNERSENYGQENVKH